MTGMTDREIVERLRFPNYENAVGGMPVLSIDRARFDMLAAADAIERLTKERGEALEALRILLDKSEKHIFGDECLTERDAARSILSKYEAKS